MSVIATVNCMATDMPDFKFACKEACRDMSTPKQQSWKPIKAVGMCSLTLGDANVNELRHHHVGRALDEHNHSSPTLSSCEAGYCAVTDGASRAVVMQTAAKELGIVIGDLAVEMATNSGGAKSFAFSPGSCRIRHIEVKLWEVGYSSWWQLGGFCTTKVVGTKNPSDILMKYKACATTRASW